VSLSAAMYAEPSAVAHCIISIPVTIVPRQRLFDRAGMSMHDYASQ